MARSAEAKQRRETDRPKVMSREEWLQKHLRRSPARDEEWVRRVRLLHGRP